MKNGIFVALLGMVAASAHAAAPPAPESVVREIYAYLLQPRRDIGQDPQAQNSWLTGSLRELLRQADRAAKAALKCPDAGPDQRPPDNAIFLDAWDAPTSCNVTGTTKDAASTRVSVLCGWGPKTNYPGEQRRMTAVLQQEGGAWRIADIESHASKFSKENTLVRSLKSLTAEAESVSANCSKRGASAAGSHKADPSDILKGESLGWLKLGLPEAIVIRNLAGAPQKGKDTLWAALGTHVQEWKYPEHGIVLNMESERRGQPKRVLSFKITSPSQLRTQRNIGIGSTEVEVTNAYKAYREAETSAAGKIFVAGSIYGGLIFHFRTGRVESIFVGAAAE